MKRSKSIFLVLPVAAAMTACKPEETVTKYDSYTTLEDCAKEWEVKACELKTHPQSGDLVWVGPPYQNNKPVYKDESGQTHERKSSPGVAYLPIFIPNNVAAPAASGYTPQGSARPFASPPTSPSISAPRPSVPSVSAPSVASRGGFGSTSVSVGSSAGG